MVDDRVERWSAPFAWLYSLCSANPRSNRLVVAEASPGRDDVVVDVGCGAGAAVRAAARVGATAVGIDPSSAMVTIATRRSRGVPGTRFAEGDAGDLPLDDASVTIAWAIATFHHWPDRRAGLDELRRVLRPGGRLLLGEKRLRRPDGHGLTTDGAEEAAELLRRLGYRDVTVEHRRLTLLSMMIIGATA